MVAPEDSARVERAALLALLPACGIAWAGFSPKVGLSCLGGGLLAVVNLRVMLWLFRGIIAGGSQSAWLVLPLIGKSGLLLGLVTIAALVFGADVLALAVGFSIVVFTVAAVGSVQYLRRARDDQA